jgi:CheY-like chemotaxis protein
VPPASATLPQGAAATPVRLLRGLRVLLVDDHEDTLRGMAQALEANGARVTAVGSVGEALAQFDRGRPDVIVSDIAMPERDGHDLVQSIRSRPEGAGGLTPAIALSAYVSVEDRLRALAAGYQDHVPKPVEVPRLVYTIARLARP